MNEYRICDISIGMTECFSKTITAEMMNQFLAITGDENPLHTDEAFAKSYGFPGCVAYGMLTSSLISTLGGCYLPGKYCLIHSVEVKFAKPVFIGDIIMVQGEVTHVRADWKIVEIKVTMRNQKNEIVLRGLLKAGVME